MRELGIQTGSRTEFIDVTGQIAGVVADSGIQDGLVNVFVPHTTAGITINENADPDVLSDMELALDRMVPWQNGYAHCEGNSAAHVKATLTGSSVSIIVSKGRLLLGTWQGIYFAEYDGPRRRKLMVKVVAG